MAELKSIETIPNINSTDQDWIAWYKVLRKDIGKLNANTEFVHAWESRKNEDPIFGSKANTSALRDYLKDQGITLSGDGAFGFAYDALDTIDDWASSFFNTSKWVLIIVFFVLIIPIFILMINVARKPSEAIGALKIA